MLNAVIIIFLIILIGYLIWDIWMKKNPTPAPTPETRMYNAAIKEMGVNNMLNEMKAHEMRDNMSEKQMYEKQMYNNISPIYNDVVLNDFTPIVSSFKTDNNQYAMISGMPTSTSNSVKNMYSGSVIETEQKLITLSQKPQSYPIVNQMSTQEKQANVIKGDVQTIRPRFDGVFVPYTADLPRQGI
jgi:hypothetical protein